MACLDEGQRLCGEEGANKAAGRSGKPGACWRAPTKEKGFARRKAPTKKPAGRENLERVGVSRYLPSAAAMSFVYSRTLFRCVAFIGTNVDINSKKRIPRRWMECCYSLQRIHILSPKSTILFKIFAVYRKNLK